MDKNRDAHLNSALTQSRQLYEKLIGITPNLSYSEINQLPNAKRVAFEAIYSQLMSALEIIDDSLQESSLNEGIGNISNEGYKFYKSEIESNRRSLDEIIITLLDLHDYDFEVSSNAQIDNPNPIWNILVSGYDYWSNDDRDEFDSEEIRKTEKLLFSRFFIPDLWMENLELVRPVLGDSAKNRLPGDIRELIKENFRSFILGNYLASIALSGSVLEYVLVDRAPSFEINQFSDNPKFPNRFKKLGILISEYAEKLPEISIHLETIVESRNRTIHPKHKQKLFLQPKALQKTALNSLTALKEAVEKLYFG